MSACGGCKYWGDKKDTGEEFRKCVAVIHDERSYANTDIYDDPDDEEWIDEEIRAEIKAVRAHRAVVVDGSGYYAALKCKADFGCVLWVQSETVPA